jgi:hypothetical protein
MNLEEGTVVTVYCPYCDRPYQGSSRRTAENRAKTHVREQHPEMPNPFDEDEL